MKSLICLATASLLCLAQSLSANEIVLFEDTFNTFNSPNLNNDLEFRQPGGIIRAPYSPATPTNVSILNNTLRVGKGSGAVQRTDLNTDLSLWLSNSSGSEFTIEFKLAMNNTDHNWSSLSLLDSVNTSRATARLSMFVRGNGTVSITNAPGSTVTAQEVNTFAWVVTMTNAVSGFFDFVINGETVSENNPFTLGSAEGWRLSWIGIAGSDGRFDDLRVTLLPDVAWETDFADLAAPVALDFGDAKDSVDDLLKFRPQDFLLQADSVRYEPTSTQTTTSTALASISNYTAGQNFLVESEMTIESLPNPGPNRAGLVVLGGPHVPGTNPFTSSAEDNFYTLSLHPGETLEDSPVIRIREGYTGAILAEETWLGQAFYGAGDSYTDDFEDIAVSQAAWTSGGTNNLWEVGQPTSGPGAAYSGENVFATKLDGSFQQNTEGWLRSPVIDLTSAKAAVLSYADWHQLDTNIAYHWARVSVLDASTNGELEVLSLTTGATGGWRLQELFLSGESLGREVVIEFRLKTDSFVDVQGWYIDDVEVSSSAHPLPMTFALAAQGIFSGDGSLDLSFTVSEGLTEQTVLTSINNPFFGNLFGIGGRSQIQVGGAPVFDFNNLTIELGSTPAISAIANQTIFINTSTGPLNFTLHDEDVDPSLLTVSGTSSNLDLVPNENIVIEGDGIARTVTVTPLPHVDGVATITLTVEGGAAPASSSFLVNVVWPQPPTITAISNRIIQMNTSTGAIMFSVGHETIDPGDISVSGLSSNTGLVPNENIVFGGSGASRTVTLTPAAGATGIATITLTVDDGLQSNSASFDLVVVSDAEPSVDVVVNPAQDPSPEFFLARAWHWDIDGDQEGWIAADNAHLALVPGAPLNGLISGTSAGNDPQWVSPENLGIEATEEMIIEFRVRKDSADATRMDLFWADSNGEFHGDRRQAIEADALPRDGEFHVVRIHFTNRIQGILSQLRFDPISETPGIGMTFDLDYFRIYTTNEPQPSAAPRLAIERVSETEVRISWLAEATGWSLQRSSGIEGGFGEAALEVVVEGNENASYDVIIDSRQFYRLTR